MTSKTRSRILRATFQPLKNPPASEAFFGFRDRGDELKG